MQDRGVFITWDFFKDKSLTLSEKFIILEIQNLSALKLGCIASNDHFSNLMGIKKEAVSRLISSLVSKGYIESKIKNGSRNFGRVITINKMLFDPKQNVISPLTNCLESKGNKTNNKRYNKESDFSLSKNTFIDDCSSVYLTELEKYLKSYIDDISLKRISLNSPLGDPMEFDDFILALRSSGKKYRNYVSTYRVWMRRESERHQKTA